jgi:glycosyltransferase involved in cell wall biosynthesis
MKNAYSVFPASGLDRTSAARCRILFVVGQLGGGGLEQQICYLLKTMDRQEYPAALAVWNYRQGDAHVAKVKALNVPTWGYPLAMSSGKKIVELARLARSLSPEVIHSYTFFTNFAAFSAARASGSIAIGSIRNELDLDLIHEKPLLGRLSSAFPRYQISNSFAAAAKATGNGRRFKPKWMKVVQNGLDLDRFRVRALPIGPPHRILGIGSLVTSKRWDRLLQLGQDLKLLGLDCRIQIAGDGPLRSELENLSIQKGIADRTEFLGYRSDVSDLISESRLVVHCSDGEGSPNAIMEALAAGRPVVATDVGDVAKIVENGKTGFVVPRQDPGAMLAKASAILTDDDLARSMGASAQEYARREFGLDRLVRDTFNAYHSAGWDSGKTSK